MKKSTLSFPTLEQLVQFAHSLNSGYVINTITLTITANLSEYEIQAAARRFHAVLN